MSVPEVLFRIHDNKSFNQKSLGGGFVAGDATPFDITAKKSHTRKMLRNHLAWGNRNILTPFISTSDSRGWITGNARKRKQHGNGNVRIAVIFTQDLEGVEIHSMEKLVDEYDIDCKFPCDHEWVFVGRIPEEAIVADCTIKEFQKLDLAHLKSTHFSPKY